MRTEDKRLAIKGNHNNFYDFIYTSNIYRYLLTVLGMIGP